MVEKAIHQGGKKEARQTSEEKARGPELSQAAEETWAQNGLHKADPQWVHKDVLRWEDHPWGHKAGPQWEDNADLLWEEDMADLPWVDKTDLLWVDNVDTQDDEAQHE